MTGEPPKKQRFSYDIVAMDSGSELPRLEQQVRVVQQLEEPRLDSLQLAADAMVVDLGCGPGFMSRTLAARVPRGQVVGVDTSPDLLAHARELFTRQGLDNGTFLEGLAHQLPLEPGSVDLVYARFLFQHLSNPGEVLQEAKRVLRPGGWMMVLDTDDGSLLVHPEPEGLGRLLDASRRSQARVGGDRLVGRKLRMMLMDAGFDEVRLDLQPFTSDMVGMHTFLDITLGYKQQIIDPEILPAEEVAASLEQLSALDRGAGAFAHAMGYFGFGKAPGLEADK